MTVLMPTNLDSCSMCGQDLAATKSVFDLCLSCAKIAADARPFPSLATFRLNALAKMSEDIPETVRLMKDSGTYMPETYQRGVLITDEHHYATARILMGDANGVIPDSLKEVKKLLDEIALEYDVFPRRFDDKGNDKWMTLVEDLFKHPSWISLLEEFRDKEKNNAS